MVKRESTIMKTHHFYLADIGQLLNLPEIDFGDLESCKKFILKQFGRNYKNLGSSSNFEEYKKFQKTLIINYQNIVN